MLGLQHRHQRLLPSSSLMLITFRVLHLGAVAGSRRPPLLAPSPFGALLFWRMYAWLSLCRFLSCASFRCCSTATTSAAPSSGGTSDHPSLLQYSCQLVTNVRVLQPCRVSLPLGSQDAPPVHGPGSQNKDSADGAGELMNAVLGGWPVVTLAFDDMEVRELAVYSFLVCVCTQRHRLLVVGVPGHEVLVVGAWA